MSSRNGLNICLSMYLNMRIFLLSTYQWYRGGGVGYKPIWIKKKLLRSYGIKGNIGKEKHVTHVFCILLLELFLSPSNELFEPRCSLKCLKAPDTKSLS